MQVCATILDASKPISVTSKEDSTYSGGRYAISPTHIYLPTHLPTYLPTYPVHLPTHPLTHLPTHPPTHPPTYPPTYPPTHPTTYPLIYPPTHPPTHPSTYPSIHSSTHPPRSSGSGIRGYSCILQYPRILILIFSISCLDRVCRTYPHTNIPFMSVTHSFVPSVIRSETPGGYRDISNNSVASLKFALELGGGGGNKNLNFTKIKFKIKN